jgi:hypothetical protein
MQTVSDILDAIAKPQSAAAIIIDTVPSALSHWKRRGIPREKWPDIVKASKGRVAYDDLERVEALTVGLKRRKRA